MIALELETENRTLDDLSDLKLKVLQLTEADGFKHSTIEFSLGQAQAD